jgi:20S proteasome subunit alpha 7
MISARAFPGMRDKI